jgi:hypothetical protein
MVLEMLDYLQPDQRLRSLSWSEIRPQPPRSYFRGVAWESHPVATQPHFPEVYFLDHGVFKRTGMALPLQTQLELSPVLTDLLHQADSIRGRFFSWVHL